MQVDGRAVAAPSPPWQARQVSILGIRTSALVLDEVALWQSVHGVVECAAWSNCAFGIHRAATLTGCTSHWPFALASGRVILWHTPQSDRPNTSSSFFAAFAFAAATGS